MIKFSALFLSTVFILTALPAGNISAAEEETVFPPEEQARYLPEAEVFTGYPHRYMQLSFPLGEEVYEEIFEVFDTRMQEEPESPVVMKEGSQLIVVNKTRSLPSSYTPSNLTVPEVYEFGSPPVRAHVAEALEDMFADAAEENLQLIALSGYRSYDRQVEIFDSNVEARGFEEANQYSAQPGQSEHQTGLAMDVSSPELSESGDYLTAAFADTAEGEWVLEHARDYGFIIRYPEGKESITGYQYEPWHLRYVGKELAQYLEANELTIEEYIDEEYEEN